MCPVANNIREFEHVAVFLTACSEDYDFFLKKARPVNVRADTADDAGEQARTDGRTDSDEYSARRNTGRRRRATARSVSTHIGRRAGALRAGSARAVESALVVVDVITLSWRCA